MIRLALLRHAPTSWNLEGRLQGRADPPIDPAARRDLGRLALPAAFADADFHVSPLRRARDTALALGLGPVAVEPRLIEMDWGEWEGQRLDELRRRLGAEFAAVEARGLDFQPPGGESPRMVQQRIRPWLAEVAAAGRPVLAVTHKGVMRAALALAAGWDMTGRPPLKFAWPALLVLDLATDGRPRLAEGGMLALGEMRR